MGSGVVVSRRGVGGVGILAKLVGATSKVVLGAVGKTDLDENGRDGVGLHK